MRTALPNTILNLSGPSSVIEITCRRDKRCKAKDPVTNQPGTINRFVTRKIKDLPLVGQRCILNIELAEVRNKEGVRRIEHCDFIEKGNYYTKRFCQFISGLCRYMSIQSVATHFSLRWETVKNMDKAYLQKTLPALQPNQLKNLKFIGVDEVARAKGHNYMTVVYNLISGELIWVETGRTSDVFSKFLTQLTTECAENIKAIGMDMGLAYQKSVRESLPKADIVFDRFHVMQAFSKTIDNQRRIEFRRSDKHGKMLLKGCRFLLLRNRENLNEEQEVKLSTLLEANTNISALYIFKEQLQKLWSCNTYGDMVDALDKWCDLANQTEMIYLKKFTALLQKCKEGICNYAKYKLTSARIEAGNVGIGMLRKRARGIRDTDYFKLKIRQLGLAEVDSFIYI